MWHRLCFIQVYIYIYTNFSSAKSDPIIVLLVFRSVINMTFLFLFYSYETNIALHVLLGLVVYEPNRI